MFQHFTFVRVNINDIAGVHVLHITFNGQGAGIFHGVKENRGNLATDTDTAVALVGDIGDIVTDIPQHRVGG